MSTALLVFLCMASGANAENANCSGGTPPQIEPGRSETITAPMISWDDQRALVAQWPSTGSLTPSAETATGGTGTSDSSCQTSTGASGIAYPAAAPSTCDIHPGSSGGCPISDSGTCPTAEPAACATTTPGTCPIHPGSSGGICPTATPTAQPDQGTDGHYTPGTMTSQEQYLYQSINADRVAYGLSSLPIDEELSALAREKSADMINNNYFAHESPTYGDAREMLTDAGYSYTSASENISRSASVEKGHAALMSSDGHRRTILGSQWKRVGIGVVNDENGYPYITELFVR